MIKSNPPWVDGHVVDVTRGDDYQQCCLQVDRDFPEASGQSMITKKTSIDK